MHSARSVNANKNNDTQSNVAACDSRFRSARIMAYSSNTTYSTRLEVLSCDNYDTWRIQADALFIKNDTWAYVCGENKPPVASGEGVDRAEAEIKYMEWMAANRKAKADLILCIAPSELKQVKSCVTSHDVWKKLESIYTFKGPARKAALLKRLTQHKMVEGDDMKKHLAEFFDAVDKLESMDI